MNPAFEWRDFDVREEAYIATALAHGLENVAPFKTFRRSARERIAGKILDGVAKSGAWEAKVLAAAPEVVAVGIPGYQDTFIVGFAIFQRRAQQLSVFFAHVREDHRGRGNLNIMLKQMGVRPGDSVEIVIADEAAQRKARAKFGLERVQHEPGRIYELPGLGLPA